MVNRVEWNWGRASVPRNALVSTIGAAHLAVALSFVSTHACGLVSQREF